MPVLKINQESTSTYMQGFFGLPPDRRTKRMPQSLQAPLPLAVHPSRIALHRLFSNAAR